MDALHLEKAAPIFRLDVANPKMTISNTLLLLLQSYRRYLFEKSIKRFMDFFFGVSRKHYNEAVHPNLNRVL